MQLRVKTDVWEEAACLKQMNYEGAAHHFLFPTPVREQSHRGVWTELLSSHLCQWSAKYRPIFKGSDSWKEKKSPNSEYFTTEEWLSHALLFYCAPSLHAAACRVKSCKCRPTITQCEHFISWVRSGSTRKPTFLYRHPPLQAIGLLAHWTWSCQPVKYMSRLHVLYLQVLCDRGCCLTHSLPLLVCRPTWPRIFRP